MSDRDEIRARLRNWGWWARGGNSALMAHNGLWSMACPRKTMIYPADVDDAEIVEFTLTSLAQPARADQWRRWVPIVVAHYAVPGRAKDKAEALGIHRSWYFESLKRAERILAGITPYCRPDSKPIN